MDLKLKHIIVLFITLSLVLFAVYLYISSHGPEQTTNQWTMYRDSAYGYTFDYPPDLNAQQKQERTIPPSNATGDKTLTMGGGVNIAQKDGYGIIDLSIFYNTNYVTPDDWLAEERTLFADHGPVIEKRIMIGGQDAIVTHTDSDNEAGGLPQYEKTAVFIKDGALYKLTTRFVQDTDHERVWNSFRFSK